MEQKNALRFIESAPLPAHPEATLEGALGALGDAPLDLDKLPPGVVSTNALVDLSAAPADLRGGVSLALAFASRAATGAMTSGFDEDDWFAAYKTNLAKLGFRVSQSAVTRSTFRKRGVFVHKAFIPFLTIALGGAGIGPVILALLNNLQEMDKDRPWITLFDRQSRIARSRETHFAAIASDTVESNIRHVAARLAVEEAETNVLFFRITDATADFESATTTLTANNSLLAVLEQPLKERLAAGALDFIKEAALAPR